MDILLTGPYAYDTVWSVAVALNDTITTLEQTNSPKQIQDFSYTEFAMGNLILEFMKNVQMFGATVRLFELKSCLCDF